MADEISVRIVKECYRALDRVGASPDLLAILGSYGDTLDDAEVLDLLVDYNKTGQLFKAVN